MDHDNLQVPVQCTDKSCDLPCVEGEDTWPITRDSGSFVRPFNDGDQAPSVPSQASGGGTIQDQEELQRLKRERTCKVCLEEWVHVVLIPCGHLVCEECPSKRPSCPLCRGEIQQRFNIYLS